VHAVRAPAGSVFDVGLYDPETLQRLPVTWAHSVGDGVTACQNVDLLAAPLFRPKATLQSLPK
jgi:hypothetical protein